MPVLKIMPVAAVPRTPVNTPALVDRPYKTLDHLGAIHTTIQLSKRMPPDRQLIALHWMRCKYLIGMTALTQICNRVQTWNIA